MFPILNLSLVSFQNISEEQGNRHPGNQSCWNLGRKGNIRTEPIKTKLGRASDSAKTLANKDRLKAQSTNCFFR